MLRVAEEIVGTGLRFHVGLVEQGCGGYVHGRRQYIRYCLIMYSLLQRISAAIVAVMVTLYIAVIGGHAGAGDWNFWPFSWLWIPACVAIIFGTLFIVLAVLQDRKVATGGTIDKRKGEPNELLSGRVYARRIRSGQWKVYRTSTNVVLGVVTPVATSGYPNSIGGYQAHRLGASRSYYSPTYGTLSDAMSSLLDLR